MSFRNHVLFTLAYSLNKFARVSLYIIFFFGFCFLYFLTPHLSRAQGGFLNTPLIQSSDGVLTRLNCGVPSQPPSFAGSFLLFISSHSDFSNRVTHAASHPSAFVWRNWEGKPHRWAGPLPSTESVTSGKHYANALSLRKFFWVFLSFGGIWLYCNLMKNSAIIYRLLDESIAPLVWGKIFHP